jgi:helicase MOV-10
MIGTTEEFQGQERLIMILSTVRSSINSPEIGFLSNEKRFNVAVTRAQALLIVIGDSKLLSKDHCWRRAGEKPFQGWRQLVDLCNNNSAVRVWRP